MRRRSRAGAGKRHATDRALRWIGAEVPPGHFFEGQHVLVRIVPFLATGAVPFLLLPLLGVPFPDWRVALALAISLAIIATALLLPWERLPSWTQVLPVLAGFAVIALLRDVSAEDAAIFEPLVIVPITWLALYGTRAQLWAGIASMVAIMALPPLLIGPPIYDGDQVIRAGLAAVIAGTTGVAVQLLVASTRDLAIDARAILETSQDAFISVDEEGTILEWNPAAERAFGWRQDEMVDESIIEKLIPPAEREAGRTRLRYFAEHVAQPISERFEAGAMHKDGRVFAVEVRASPVLLGGRLRVNCFIHDISERKRAQKLLQEAEERFRRAFEENRVGMALLSDEGVFTRVNTAFCELLAYSPDEVIGTPFPEITHPDDIEESLAAVREIVAGQRYGYRAEKRCLHSKGHHVWTAVNVSPIRDESGELLHLIAQVEDITERKEQEARLTHQALHDPLTGLPNRVLFADRVRVVASRRDSGSFGVIYIDLDTFKPINDTFGHSAGDAVLVEVARRLESRLREGDTLARLGGDEFAVLCDDTDEAEARLVAERVIEEFAKPFSIGDREVSQAASVGVAVQPRDGRAMDPEQVLRWADLAMYRAKAAGTSRYAMFEGWMGEGHPDRGGLEKELRRGLAEGELTVHYQPEVDLNTGMVTGAEALVRWQHPERGLLEPAEFMFVAEDNDLIVGIDDFVLWQACHEAARWRQELPDEARFVISVNLSERRLAEAGLSNKIAQAISDAELPADSLCLEVAERAVLDRRGDALSALPDLEALGVRLLIDDFGVALSSFNSIQRLPRLNAIKIDHSFIAGLGRSREDSIGVAAIVGLAHGLKLTATAEGVETPEQLAELRGIDCDRAQGYYFARPQPPEGFRELLASASYGELLA
jgi:diguanylate cyclase (GGDEF)-like protein/PAS domain S-box-containing protein